jgi:hypothetical protein
MRENIRNDFKGGKFVNSSESENIGTRWYKAYEIISLMLGIFFVLKIFGGLVGAILLKFTSELNYYALKTLSAALTSMLLKGALLAAIAAVIFFLTFNGLHKAKKSGLYLIYAQNIIFPLEILLLIPSLNSLANRFFLLSGSDNILALRFFKWVFLLGIPLVTLLFAAGIAFVLYLNTRYFKKRENLFH